MGTGVERSLHRRRVTSFDVARPAHASGATVSRAFTTPDRSAPDKRERICETTSHLGYVPNAIAFGSRDGLRVTGIPVPETMSVTGFDGLPQSTRKAYDLTTIPARQLLEGQSKIRTTVANRRGRA
jgi:DNA-binding LacI/PurR family transcriptional regulator